MGGDSTNTINEAGMGLAVDDRAADPSAWSVIANGSVTATNVDFGPFSFTTVSDDAFVAKLDATTGAFQWARIMGGTAQDTSYSGVSLDSAGNIYTAGMFGVGSSSTADLDPGPGTFTVTAGAFNDGYISMLDANGNFAAAWQTIGATGGNHNYARNIAADPNGNLWVSGHIESTTTFPTGQTITPTGQGGIYLMRMDAPHGTIQGTVYGDWNNNGAHDANESGLPGRTVYIDTNGNGQLDSGEPSAVSDATGHYEIANVAPGTYTVRQVAVSGWTVTKVGGAMTVTVGDGFALGNDIGDFAPNTSRTYSNTTAQKTNRGKPNAISTIKVNDAALVYDLAVTLNVSNTQSYALTIYLTAPDGTKVTLAASSVVNGTVTYRTSLFDFKSVKGTWTLEVDGLSGGTLNSWSLALVEGTTP